MQVSNAERLTIMNEYQDVNWSGGETGWGRYMTTQHRVMIAWFVNIKRRIFAN
jgi:hypothetical protein